MLENYICALNSTWSGWVGHTENDFRTEEFHSYQAPETSVQSLNVISMQSIMYYAYLHSTFKIEFLPMKAFQSVHEGIILFLLPKVLVQQKEPLRLIRNCKHFKRLYLHQNEAYIKCTHLLFKIWLRGRPFLFGVSKNTMQMRITAMVQIFVLPDRSWQNGVCTHEGKLEEKQCISRESS